jgi:hypothetical protein
LSTRTLLIVGATSFLGLLSAILIIALLARRKKAHSKNLARAAESATNGPPTWQNGQVSNAVPGNMPLPLNNTSNSHMPPWPVASANDEPTSPPPLGMPSMPTSLQQLQVSPYVHLLQPPNGGSTGLVNDPNFEAIKRQAQLGLFAIPGQHRNEEPTS